MLSTERKYNTSPNFLNAICNEMAQPLTTMNSLIELWKQGLAEPNDLTIMRQELTRINAVLKALKALNIK